MSIIPSENIYGVRFFDRIFCNIFAYANLLMSMSLEMTPRLATALSFGLRTDTLSFTRAFNQVDLRALMWLNTWVDDALLQSIQAPLRTPETLESFQHALATMIQKNGLVLAPINNLVRRDDLAQVADFLFATSNTDVVCVYGIQRNKVLLSARSRREHLPSVLHLQRIPRWTSWWTCEWQDPNPTHIPWFESIGDEEHKRSWHHLPNV